MPISRCLCPLRVRKSSLLAAINCYEPQLTVIITVRAEIITELIPERAGPVIFKSLLLD